MMDYLSFQLPEAFVDGYKDKHIEWGFDIGGGNSLSELTYITKYSMKREDGSKERWHETCERVINGMFSILKDHAKMNGTYWNGSKALSSAKEAYDLMFRFRWTPPGRGLENMGKYVVNGERNAAMLYNCFAGEERIVTRTGVHSLKELADTDVDVLTSKGWESASVKSFGQQELQKVTFRSGSLRKGRGDGVHAAPFARSKLRRTVRVTPDHRWILSDGSQTTELMVGDYVKGNAAPVIKDDSYWDGFVHGIVFGDGTRCKVGRKTPYNYKNGDSMFKVRAADDSLKLQMFNENVMSRVSKTSTSPSLDGDYLLWVRSSRNLKEFPHIESPEYMAGFLDGWICADGTYDKSGTTQLHSQHPEALSWIEEYAPLSGFILVGVGKHFPLETNFGIRKNDLFTFTLRREALWQVESIEEDGAEEVFCAVVPESAEFTLADGILTGNCSVVSFEKISVSAVHAAIRPFVLLMEQSLNGIGVGYTTVNHGRIVLHQPDESEEVEWEVQDTRESWAESLGVLLESFFFPGRNKVCFIYDKIRESGAILHRSGGRASGPEPLRRMHNKIYELLSNREGEELTDLDIMDICNLAAKAVVAGGKRRSALLSLGSMDSKEFINAKNWEVYPERCGTDGWAHLSNNSVQYSGEEDVSHLFDLIAANGEPGLVNLDLSRRYGRLGDAPNNKDEKVVCVNPCAEIVLEPFELCNLSEMFMPHFDSKAEFLRTIKYAYLYSKAVTLLPTPWPEVNEVIVRNRRIGLSVTGVTQFLEDRNWNTLRVWLDEGYGEVQRWDEVYSSWLGVRLSIKTTSIKPSGTVGILGAVTPGDHWPTESGEYFRRQRFSVYDPMVDLFIDAGYHVEPDVMDPDFTVVVTFPTVGPSMRSEKEVSIWEKAALAALCQRYWADNSVSVTITFDPLTETSQIGPVIKAYTDQLKTMSFLPMDPNSYPQMPYEGVVREEWSKHYDRVSKIDWDAVYEHGEEAQGDKFCNNDRCEIPQR